MPPLAGLIAFIAVGLAIAGPPCDPKKLGEKEKQEKARLAQLEKDRNVRAQARRDEQCKVVKEAELGVFLRGRIDLIQADACDRIRRSCDYKVEFLFELSKSDKAYLGDSIAKIGIECGDELKFALKHGLEAFRDHRELLETAVEEALERAREDVPRASRSSPLTEQDPSSPFYDPGKGKR